VPAGIVALALLAWTPIAVALIRTGGRHAPELADAPSPGILLAAIALIPCAIALRTTPLAAAGCGVTSIALLVAGDADRRTGYLYDALTLPTALIVATLAIAGNTTWPALCGVALLVGSFGTLFIVTRGRLMGLGDIKAMFSIGAAFGPMESLIAIVVACVSGVVAAAVAGKLQRGASVAFGPHLAAGSAVSLIAGDSIVHRIMGL
jgi:leader peptidase (prepilin peptidase)/N-methyltransferase